MLQYGIVCNSLPYYNHFLRKNNLKRQDFPLINRVENFLGKQYNIILCVGQYYRLKDFNSINQELIIQEKIYNCAIFYEGTAKFLVLEDVLKDI